MLRARLERFGLREAFTIARGAKSEAQVVVAQLDEGRGEAVPYARYGETPEGVLAQIRGQADWLAAGGDRAGLLERMPAGAARNAIDLALWDRESKRAGRRAWELAGLAAPAPLAITATIPILGPDATRERARTLAAGSSLLKLKLGGPEDLARLRAAREGAPGARLVVDANEGWDRATLDRMAPALAEARVELLEQPLPAGEDAALAGWEGPLPLCADESFHGADPSALVGRYGAVNVKLDKQGGLTAALEAMARAEALGLDVMLGCMVASSLAIAPATLLAARARWVDLDGATFLAEDRPHALALRGGRLHPPERALWG